MDKKKWILGQEFIFPETAGIPGEILSLKVTPGYTEERTDQAVKLDGIYHIAAAIRFTEGTPRTAESAEGAVLVNDVEINDNVGYFEYAVPLQINLPPDANSPLQIVASESRSEADGSGLLTIEWDVECFDSVPETFAEASLPASSSYHEPVAVAETALDVQEAEQQESTSSLQANEALSFLAGLEDGYSTTVFSSSSNNIFMKQKSDPAQQT